MSKASINHSDKKGDKLLLGFAILAAFNLIAGVLHLDWLGYLTKPLLVSFLAAWYYQYSRNVRNNKFFQAFLMGLCFSILGDTLLMFVQNKGELFFMLGLSSFLIAHLFYILAFSLFPSFKSGPIARHPLLTIPFLIVWMIVTIYLWVDLGALRIPVVAYSFVIIAMLAFCFNMRNRVPRYVAQTLFLGSVLFVLSDFTIAFTKFKNSGLSPSIVGLIIMSTYLTGQFLLTSGMKKAGERFV